MDLPFKNLWPRQFVTTEYYSYFETSSVSGEEVIHSDKQMRSPTNFAKLLVKIEISFKIKLFKSSWKTKFPKYASVCTVRCAHHGNCTIECRFFTTVTVHTVHDVCKKLFTPELTMFAMLAVKRDHVKNQVQVQFFICCTRTKAGDISIHAEFGWFHQKTFLNLDTYCHRSKPWQILQLFIKG